VASKKFHLIANAHLDPVWLWDWPEGLNEGIITCRAVLDLMDETPGLTFSRGESSIYEHIEINDPGLFARIAAYVKQGRWEIVGGTYVQPDMNIPSTEMLTRHFTRGQNYFKSRFGKTVRVGWSADCFGHPAGLPEIMAAAGIQGYAFTRPDEFAYRGPFWWYGPGGSRVLGYRPLMGWYGTQQDEIQGRLDGLLEKSAESPVQNVGVFYGLGNHGGGPSRQQLADIAKWKAQHPEVNVVFSGMHGLIDALYAEAEVHGEGFFPSHTGELQYVARGCYSSLAKLKFAYRKLESCLASAERTAALVDIAAGDGAKRSEALASAWDAALFNTFHDILPGSSIERAFDQQIEWAGGGIHQARSVELCAINKLANLVDTSVRPTEGYKPTGAAVLLWNPHPFAINAPVEIEANIGYRPDFAYLGRGDELPIELIEPDGTHSPCQRIRQDALCMDNPPWRVRVLAQPALPPFGWAAYELAHREGAPPLASPVRGSVSAPEEGVIENDCYRVEARVGAEGIAIGRLGKPVFGDDGLRVVTVEDPHGSWGEHVEGTGFEILNDVRYQWKISQVETIEKGPMRSMLWVRLTGGHSTLDLMISVSAGRDAVDVSARLLWDERSARVRLTMPLAGAKSAVYDMPGGATERGEEGEVPGGRFVRVNKPDGHFGFASDSLSSYSLADGVFGATIARASRYSSGYVVQPDENVFDPAVDRGELKFRFLVSPGDDALEDLAAVLSEPPVVQTVLAREGKLARSGSLGAVEPEDIRVLAVKPAEDGQCLVVRVHNASDSDRDVTFTLADRRIALGNVPKGRIASWKLARVAGGWQASPADSLA